VGAFELRGVIIGTIRVVPMGRGLTLTETLLGQPGSPQVLLGNGSWEVGRLVLAPEYRSDPDALKRCLFLSLSYLCRHTEAQDLFASCSHVLSRLYRRFGFSAFTKDVVLAGTEKSYTLIQGYAPQVLKALSGNRADNAQLAGAPH
jgi:predicted GNAT family N-acyltransferase